MQLTAQSAERSGRARRLGSRKRERAWHVLPVHLLLLVCGFFWIYTFLWMVGSSLKTTKDFFDRGLDILPGQVAWSNYSQAWNEGNFGPYFLNTVLISVGVVILVVLFTAMAGYALARTRFPGKRLVLVLIALTLFLPHGYTIIPIFDLITRLGLLNSLASVVIVETAGGVVLSTFLFMGYFASIDQDIENAARVDGANFHQRFWLITLPLARPIIATVALLTFIGSWNNFFIPLVFTLGVPELRTLAVGMFAFVGENTVDWTSLAAGSVITLAPIVLVFIFLQRYFISGIAGAVKS